MSTPRHEMARNLHGLRQARPRSVKPEKPSWASTVGKLAHECIGELIDYRLDSPPELARRCMEWVNENARDTKSLGGLPKARSHIGSLACAYLLRYAPGPEARFLGSEVRLRGKRVDLAWDIPEFGVVVDELKTTSSVAFPVNNAALAQPQRYSRLGAEEWGERFAGVRFLPLRHPHEARWITPDGTTTLLKDSSAALLTRPLAAGLQ